MLDRQKRADQVYAQHLRPKLRGLLQERRQAAGNPGIGVDDIEPPIGLHRQRDIAGDFAFHRDVGGETKRGPAGVADGLRRPGDPSGLAIDHHHFGAFAGEGQRARPSDAARRAGDDRDLAFEPAHPLILAP